MNTAGSISFNREIIVGVLLAAAFVSVLNQTLLIVAIPPIMEEFRVDPNQAQWVTTAFMLMNGIMIPITAFLIEKFSSRALLIFSLSVFSLGTCLGAIAPNFMVLLAARVIQAMGAGILMPLMQTVLLTIYPVHKRGAAMGMSGLVIGFAPAIGPTLSGWIIDNFTWRYLFYIIIPIAMIVLLLAIFLMKNVTEQKESRVDSLSIMLSSFGWGGLLYGFSMVGSVGWTDLSVIGAILIGTISLVLFIRRQKQQARPMLNFSVFKSREFTITTILGVFMFTVMIGIQMILPLYVQHVKGGSALDSGLMLLPGAIITGAMSPIAGRLFDRFGARGLAIIGYILMSIAAVLYLNIGLETSFPVVTVMFTIMMFGISLLMTPLMTSGINALPFELIAHGAAMNNTIRMVGASIGTAIIMSVMSSVSKASLEGDPALTMFEGIHAAIIVIAIMVLTGLITSFFLTKREKQGQASEA